MPKHLLQLLPAVVLTFLFTIPASAQSRQFTIGVEELYYRPYYYVEKSDYKGAAREIMDLFAKRNGLVFKYKALPVNRLYKQFLAGEVDLKFPDNPHWKTDLKKGRSIAYSKPVLPFIDGVMVTPANKGKGLGQLKVLGTVLGFTPWNYLDLIKSGKLRVIENNSFGGLLEQVIMGRVNGAYMNPAVARYQLSKVLQKPGALVFDPDLPHINDSYRLSSLNFPGIIGRLNHFLKENENSVREIMRKHNIIQ